MGALVNLGIVLYTAGRFEEELDVLERGLRLARARGNGVFVAHFLVNRGYLRLATGEWDQALADADAGVRCAHEVGSPYLAISGDGTAAEALRQLGNLDGARRRIDEALAAARRLGSGVTTAEQLLVAAALCGDLGETSLAVEHLQEAESLLTADRDHVLRGRVWRLRSELSDDPREREHWLRRAMTQFDTVGAFQAVELRRELG